MLDPQALIQQYQEEIAELRSMLHAKEMGVGQGTGMGMGKGDPVKKDKNSNSNGEMEKRLEELKSLILTGGAQGGDERVKEVSTVLPLASRSASITLAP